MADATAGRPEEATADVEVRWHWLRAMYAANVLVSGPIGLGTLLAPELMRGLLGVPAGDPINFGVATGAVPLAFAIAGLAGLRAPLRLSPVLGLQAVYKALFLLFVAVPLALSSGIPGYGMPVVGIFVFFVVGNLIAIPIPYVVGRAGDEGAVSAG